MASVVNAKSGSTFTNKIESIEVTYDFAVDGGATGALTLFTAAQDLVIHRVTAKVVAAVVGTSSTVEVGISGGTAIYMAQTAEASMGAGVVVDSKKGSVKLASGAAMIQTIGTAALTAGKVRYMIEYSKF